MNRPQPHRSVWLRVVGLGAFAAALAACGISPDSDITRIAPNELGPLANTTTTTTTTTTVPETVPSTSTPMSAPESTTTSTTTTTMELVETLPVSVFYAPRGDNQSLRRATVRATPDATLDDLIRLLYEPPEQITQFNLITAVTPELVLGTPEVQPLHVVVDLDQATFEQMTDASQNLAIAQLVLTLGSFTMPDGGPVGAVAFRVGGEPITVLIPGQGASEPGEPVGYRQFQAWVQPANGETPPTSAPGSPGTTPPEPVSTEPPGSAPTPN